MKTATYTSTDGSNFTVLYDENTPCIVCDLPIITASMGGTVICPWCDMGIYRNGLKWKTINKEKIKQEAKNHIHI